MTVRWGIIGCGDVCEVKSGPAFYKIRGSELVAVMRRNRALAEDFARRHGVPRFTDSANAIIDDPEVDAVYIATPPGSHCEYALAVARAGKPCYVEKPMARHAPECTAMIDAFAAAGRPLFVAYYRRAQPRFRAAQAIVAGGQLGTVMAVHHHYETRHPPAPMTLVPPDVGWRESAAESGGGLFLDLGSHVLDIMDFILGPIAETHGCSAHRATPDRSGKVEDTVSATFRFESGVIGSACYRFHTAAQVDRLEFVGTLGKLSFSVFGREPLELARGTAVERIEAPHPEHVHQPLIQTIVDELHGEGEPCPSRGESARRTSVVMDQILDRYYGGRDDAFWLRPHTWPGTQ